MPSVAVSLLLMPSTDIPVSQSSPTKITTPNTPLLKLSAKIRVLILDAALELSMVYGFIFTSHQVKNTSIPDTALGPFTVIETRSSVSTVKHCVMSVIGFSI